MKKSKKHKLPKPIPVEELSKIAMVVRNEGKIWQVIDDGAVKEWVGIGWIEIRHATPSDYLKIPQVKR